MHVFMCVRERFGLIWPTEPFQYCLHWTPYLSFALCVTDFIFIAWPHIGLLMWFIARARSFGHAVPFAMARGRCPCLPSMTLSGIPFDFKFDSRRCDAQRWRSHVLYSLSTRYIAVCLRWCCQIAYRPRYNSHSRYISIFPNSCCIYMIIIIYDRFDRVAPHVYVQIRYHQKLVFFYRKKHVIWHEPQFPHTHTHIGQIVDTHYIYLDYMGVGIWCWR